MSFPQFPAFPTEIHAVILDSCAPNDLVCLRLTCKYLYNLALSDKTPISLENTDASPLCCKEVGPSQLRHRQDCHKLSYDAARLRNESLRRPAPAMNMNCRTSYNADHCECFTRRNRLHYRLKSWMPKGMSYCGTCKNFTRTKARNNGRCLHGYARRRKAASHNWTYPRRRR